MFPLSKIQLEIELLDDLPQVNYWGTKLRGGFGTALKTGLCDYPELTTCLDCTRLQSCEFPSLFKPHRKALSKELKGRPLDGNENLPAAFVIDPPRPKCSPMRRGERLEFNFVYLGSGCEHAERPVLSFLEFARRGIAFGKDVVRFRLVDVKDIFGDGRSIYANRRVVAPTVISASQASSQFQATDGASALKVDFVTPYCVFNKNSRLKDAETGLTIFADFYDFILNLATRVACLWQLYGDEWIGQPEFFRWRERLLKAARSIETVTSDLRLVSMIRYSSVQAQHLPLNGVVGSMTFAGDFKPFFELLSIGEIVHIGQETTFGMGLCSLHWG
jgi:hypothetical protein